MGVTHPVKVAYGLVRLQHALASGRQLTRSILFFSAAASSTPEMNRLVIGHRGDGVRGSGPRTATVHRRVGREREEARYILVEETTGTFEQSAICRGHWLHHFLLFLPNLYDNSCFDTGVQERPCPRRVQQNTNVKVS